MTPPVRFILLVSAACLSMLLVGRAAAQARQAPAPVDGETASLRLIESVCGSCHTRQSILDVHRTGDEWEGILVWMADEGAVLTDDEFEQLLRFLGVAYGLVAVNSAPADEVRAVLELTDEQIALLVSARKDGRRIRTIEELASTIGAPTTDLEPRRRRIDFETH